MPDFSLPMKVITVNKLGGGKKKRGRKLKFYRGNSIFIINISILIVMVIIIILTFINYNNQLNYC